MWTKLDDHFWSHPKVLRCSRAAIGTHALALSYCSDQMTGGEIPKAAPFLRAYSSHAKELLRAGLWEKTKTGYRIHDWNYYNPTREEALAYRTRMQQVRVDGGRARAAEARRIAGRFAATGAFSPAGDQQATSSVAGDLHQQEHQQATSPVPVPVLSLKDKKLLSSTSNGNGQEAKAQLRGECSRLLADGIQSLLADGVLSQLVLRGKRLGLGEWEVREVALEVQQQH